VYTKLSGPNRLFAGLAVLALAAAWLLPGCGDGRPERISVRGRITLDGGPMPDPGMIYFTSLKAAPGFPKRPGTAPFDTDGEFTAGTFEPGDGLMPGRYAVTVVCWKKAPGMGQPEGESHLPEQYGDQEHGGWALTVEPGSDAIELKYDARSP